MSEPAYVSIVQSLQTCKFCVFVYVRGLLEVCVLLDVVHHKKFSVAIHHQSQHGQLVAICKLIVISSRKIPVVSSVEGRVNHLWKPYRLPKKLARGD